MSYDNLEIKRKFLIGENVDLKYIPFLNNNYIKKGEYIINESFFHIDKNSEIILRSITDTQKNHHQYKFEFELKDNGILMHETHTIEISSSLYKSLAPLDKIRKIRTTYEIDNYEIYVDSIRDPFERTYLDVAFNDPEVAILFEPERYFNFDQEVTDLDEHKLKNLYQEYFDINID